MITLSIAFLITSADDLFFAGNKRWRMKKRSISGDHDVLKTSEE